MKKVLKLSISFIMIIFFVLSSNLKTVYTNFKEGLNLFNGIDLSKFEVILGMVLIATSVMLVKKKGIYNKLSISSIIVVTGCGLLNGLFSTSNVISFIPLYAYLMLMTLFLTAFSKQRFEINLCMTVFAILLIMFGLSLFNLLYIVKYLIIISTIIAMIYIILKRVELRNN